LHHPRPRHPTEAAGIRIRTIESSHLSSFHDFGLAEPIMRALAKEKYVTPAPIQTQTIPIATASSAALDGWHDWWHGSRLGLAQFHPPSRRHSPIGASAPARYEARSVAMSNRVLRTFTIDTTRRCAGIRAIHAFHNGARRLLRKCHGRRFLQRPSPGAAQVAVR
jgi:hypothetical protein